ncbi:MAG: PEP-CTERM/exosortase system-associated acyltransferase [Elusimicrobia bacterium]|nr:PEP-CTERM/exosortase system-associated acyltransferase [Elusimicrobiota bacterium]
MFRMGEFTFLEATDPALVEAIHRLRYRIYVEEYGYEKPADHPGGLERDKFDPYSVPVAALDRKGNLVGTARMIHHCPFPLPALELASPAWREEHKNDPNLVESSRFAMSREFRLSALDFKREMAYFRKHLIPPASPSVLPSPTNETDDFSARILIFLGLSYAMIETGHSLSATYHLMTAERSLFVLLKRNGMRFAPIGPEVDYHGRRTPYAGDNEEMFRSVQSMQKRVLSFLSERAPATPPALQERALSEGESFRLGGYTFEIAATEEKVNQVFQLRYRSYAEDFQLIDPILLPERRERDLYDPWSLHAVAFDGGNQMVGTVRLVLNSSLGLPCLEAADADEKNRLASSKKVAELSRLALAHPLQPCLCGRLVPPALNAADSARRDKGRTAGSPPGSGDHPGLISNALPYQQKI